MRKLEAPPELGSILSALSEISNMFFLAREDGLQGEVLQAIDNDYLYWDKVKYKVPESLKDSISPDSLWSIVKMRRKAMQQSLHFAEEQFYYTPTNALYGQLHEFDLHLGGSFGSQNTIPEADKHRYLIGSIMEESIASSQIEGAVTSRIVAKEMLRKQRPPRNHSERMIVNNYTTIQHIVANKQRPLTPDSLLELHRLMTVDTMDKPEDCGAFKQHNDIYVVDAVDGEVIHTPPGFAILPTFVDDLCRFFNDETPTYFLHPVVKASIIHFLIGYFHPFADGNGRTARALFYWYLLKRGYWLTEYLSISRVIMQSRNQYYKAYQYTEADGNDLGYFVHYQVKAMKRAYEDLKAYIERKAIERQQVSQWQRTGNVSSRQATLLSWLHAEPNRILSVKEVETLLGTSNQTARTDLQGLVEKGYLAEVRVNQKERQFILATPA